MFYYTATTQKSTEEVNRNAQTTKHKQTTKQQQTTKQAQTTKHRILVKNNLLDLISCCADYVCQGLGVKVDRFVVKTLFKVTSCLGGGAGGGKGIHTPRCG